MGQGLPYFRWYPADAEMEQEYATMTFEEVGFYHRCLNKSWVNYGLPTDMDELARFMGTSRKILDRLWKKVGAKFVANECVHPRLVNPRQEKERAAAVDKSIKNKRPGNANASREKRERVSIANDKKRDPNAQFEEVASQQARAPADSDSIASSFLEGSAEGNEVVQISDQRDLFAEFCAAHPDKSNEDAIWQVWESFDMGYWEQVKAVDCAKRYAESGEVARGVVMKAPRWMAEQCKNNWSGKWVRAPTGPAKKASFIENVTKQIEGSLKEGKSPW